MTLLIRMFVDGQRAAAAGDQEPATGVPVSRVLFILTDVVKCSL